MAGFLLSALPVLLLGAGGIETAHWLFLRQSLGFALVEAARAAATRQAEPAALAHAFERALRILHPQPRQLGDALAWRRRALDGPPWRIRIIRPARAAFLDHADGDLGAQASGAAAGLATIRNDRQLEQHRRSVVAGWAEGRGPASGETIFEANTLALELTWPHRPLLPGVAAVLRLMAGPGSPQDYRQRVLAQGLLPIMRSTALDMHSHPARWPDLPDGRVVHGEPATRGAEGFPACPDGSAACVPPGNGPGPAPGATDTGAAPPDDAALGTGPGDPAGGPGDLASGLDDPARWTDDDAGGAANDGKTGPDADASPGAPDPDVTPPGDGLACDPPLS